MKLYVVTRKDLPPGAFCTQSCHAAIQFCMEQKVQTQYWYLKSNNLVLLEVPDEAALKHLAGRVRNAGFVCSVFHEPDYDDTATAVAIEPDAWRMLSQLPLALKAA